MTANADIANGDGERRHLPECHPKLRDITHQWEWVDEATGQTECCICHALRSCEQRVLDAARAALAALRIDYPSGVTAALAAIDALREETP